MSADEKTANKTDKKKSREKKKPLKEDLSRLQAELDESKEKYIRLFAEFDNYKKRTVKERLELIKNASADLIVALLPVLDDFERARNSAEDENSEEVFSDGVTLVYNKINNLLKSKGLEIMLSNGVEFDPEFHEAITEIPAPSEDMKGKVMDTIERGYLLNDKIIRYAKVVVGK